MKIKILSIVAVASLLGACGGEDGDGGSATPAAATPAAATPNSGTFIDSPVQGLGYSTSTLSGKTDSSGTFQYANGETVTFKVGDVVLGSAAGAATITPVTLGGPGATSSDTKVLNIASFIQTLDKNGGSWSNIAIPDAAHEALLISNPSNSAYVQQLNTPDGFVKDSQTYSTAINNVLSSTVTPYNPSATVVDTATAKQRMESYLDSKNISYAKEATTPVDYTNSLGMAFKLIPSGTFKMGSPLTETTRGFDEIQHSVKISNPFFMQTTEVTQGQWKAVMGSNPSSFSSCGDTCPVENFPWTDIQSFLTAINAKGEGTYRLPTEAEWEYAARADTTTAYSFGASETSLENYAWYSSNSGRTPHPVAQKLPNPWGLYDMHGNVWEWVSDLYGSYPSSAATDPTGATGGSIRVIRGGSWGFDPAYVRSADRNSGGADYRYSDLGLRLAMD